MASRYDLARTIRDVIEVLAVAAEGVAPSWGRLGPLWMRGARLDLEALARRG